MLLASIWPVFMKVLKADLSSLLARCCPVFEHIWKQLQGWRLLIHLRTDLRKHECIKLFFQHVAVIPAGRFVLFFFVHNFRCLIRQSWEISHNRGVSLSANRHRSMYEHHGFLSIVVYNCILYIIALYIMPNYFKTIKVCYLVCLWFSFSHIKQAVDLKLSPRIWTHNLLLLLSLSSH